MESVSLTPLDVETLVEAFGIITHNDATQQPERRHVEALGAYATMLLNQNEQLRRDGKLMAAMVDEEPDGGSCEYCGEHDAVAEVDDSDPSTGYYSVISLCRCCLAAKRGGVQ